MSKAEELEVQIEKTTDGVIVRPIGDVDLGCAATLRLRLKEVQNENPDRLIVDLGSVSYMDSSGVATLVEAMQNARRTDTKLILCALQDKVRSIFEIARLDMVFAIVEDVEKAKAF